MSNKPFFSIIIPTKNPNTGFFLECINSIKNQTIHNYEIIVVANNCSADSISFIKSVFKKDDGSKLIISNDIGVSRARNRGICEARGKYVIFLDDDDVLAPYFLESIGDYDLTVFKDTSVINQLSKHSFTNHLLLGQNEIEKLFFANENEYGIETRSVWGKAFLLDIIVKNNVRFCDNLFNGEDTCFVLEYASYCKSLLFYNDEYGYYYRPRMDSVTYRYNEDIVSQFDIYYSEYKRILDSNNVNNHKLHFVLINQIIYNIFLSYLFNKSNKKSIMNKTNELKKLFSKPQYKEALYSVKISELPTRKKKVITFLLKNHLYLIASSLLNRRYSR